MTLQIGNIRWKYIFVTSAVLLVTGWAVVGQNNLPGFAVPLLLTLGLGAWWFTNRGQASRLTLPVFVFWLALLASSALSIEPHRSLYWLAVISSGLLFTLLIARCGQKFAISRIIINGGLAAGVISVGLFYAHAINWYLAWLRAYPGEWLPWVSYRLPGGNLSGAYMAGCAVLAACLALKERKITWRMLLGVYALLAVGLVFLASSRGALVGLATAALVWAVIERHTWIQWLAPLLKFFNRRKALGAAVLVTITLALGAAGWSLLNIMASHPTHGGAVLNARALFWSVGWRMFLQSPAWGNGPYSFSAFFMQAISVPPWDIFLHPHNMHLDVLSSSGLIGAAAYLWLLWAVFRALARARRAAPPESQGIVLGATLMLAGYLGHGVFDALYQMQLASINLALVLGAALAFDPPVERRMPRWAFTAQGISVCLLAWSAVAMRAPAFQAIGAANDRNWQEASEKMENALEFIPFSPFYHAQAGLMAANTAVQGNPGALEAAAAHLEQAVQLDPYYAAHHFNLGAVYRAQGQLAKAQVEFEEAARLAPRWDLAALHTGLVAEALGETDRALRAYWSAVDLNPDAVDDAFWKGSLVRQKSLDLFRIGTLATTQADELTDEAIIRQSYAGPILERADIALQAGELDRARALVSAAGLAYSSNGLEIMELTWLKAELAAAEGDFTVASQLGVKAVDGLDVQGLKGPGTAGWALYGSGIYKMPEVESELAPQAVVFRTFGKWPERMEQLATWQQLAGDAAGSAVTLDQLKSWQE